VPWPDWGRGAATLQIQQRLPFFDQGEEESRHSCSASLPIVVRSGRPKRSDFGHCLDRRPGRRECRDKYALRHCAGRQQGLAPGGRARSKYRRAQGGETLSEQLTALLGWRVASTRGLRATDSASFERRSGEREDRPYCANCT